MHTVWIGDKAYDCPSKWSEVNGWQLRRIAHVLHGQYDRLTAGVMLTAILLEIRKKPIRFRWQFKHMISSEAKYDLLQLCDWVFESDYDNTKNLLPYFTLPFSFKKLYGPLDECSGLSFLEFIEADGAYLDFISNVDDPTKRIAALDKLVAILYRDKQQVPDKHAWNGDYRVAYNSNILRLMIPRVKRVPLDVKYSIFMFYHACHKEFESRFKSIFKKTKAKRASGGGWGNALRNLAGGALHMEQMGQTRATVALYDLNLKIQEMEEAETQNS